MEDFTIKETYKLPSLGKVYDVEVPEDITIRSMTINEEMMRLGGNGTWRALADMLDACILTPMPISSYDLCTADFTFLWHRLRVVTYGNKYPLTCECPYCKFQNNFQIDLLQLPVIYYDDEAKKYQAFELPVSQKQVTLNIQTPHMLDAIDSRMKAMRDRQGTSYNSDILLVLQLALNTVNGEALDNTSKELLLRQLPMPDINKLLIATDKLNNAFGLGVKVDAECDNCGQTFTTIFQQGSEFFRPSVDF